MERGSLTVLVTATGSLEPTDQVDVGSELSGIIAKVYVDNNHPVRAGEILARLVVTKPEHEERCRAMGIKDTKRIYRSADLASGESMIFAAAGVTEGTLMRGVRFFGDGIRTSSVIMQTHPHRVRFIDSIHVDSRPDVKVRF